MNNRVRQLNSAGLRLGADYILYWSQMNRRANSNQALSFAVALANQMDLPVMYYEGLTCSYPYASDRFHRFILEGVPETEKRLAARGIGYTFHLRRQRSDPNDAFYRLAARAAAVVTDDYPTFVAARHNASVAPKLEVSFYGVDASCIVPMACFEKREYAAYTIRPKIRRLLPRYFTPSPEVAVHKAFRGGKNRLHTRVTTKNIDTLIAACEIDHTVRPALGIEGGRPAAERQLARFLEGGLRRYARERNEPSAHATSGLSPYLHFGQIGSLEVALAARSYAREHKLIVDEFLEELDRAARAGFQFCAIRPARGLAGRRRAAGLGSATRSRATGETAATRFTRPNNSSGPRPTMRCGTLRRRNCCCAGPSTATTACIGARR